MRDFWAQLRGRGKTKPAKLSGEGPIRDQATAAALAETYAIAENVYVLGSLAKGLTLYKQQVRAHNLACALYVLAHPQEDSAIRRPLRRVAVVGGGVAGLTMAAALLSLDEDVEVTLFERRWDLCPLQQGSDTRWLHPRIYDWPAEESEQPTAKLPVLDWRAGRASDVADTILDGFADYCAWRQQDMSGESRPLDDRLSVYLGVNHLTISRTDRRVEWMGQYAKRQGRYWTAVRSQGATETFDNIIITAGFGLERGHGDTAATSYWRNDEIGQPSLAGQRRVYVVSGYGDGALVDLCRLTIERFRQDQILSQLFAEDLALVERDLRVVLTNGGGRVAENAKDVFDGADLKLRLALDLAIRRLRQRLRKDVRVILHAGGKGGHKASIRDILGDRSSFQNRTLLYMLYRAGAFTLRFDSLQRIVADHGVAEVDVIRRYGTEALDNVRLLFSDPDAVTPLLVAMRDQDAQSSRPLFPPGFFPSLA